jgi:hypothetical protein
MPFTSMISHQDSNALESHFTNEKFSGNIMQSHYKGAESRSMTASTISVMEKYTQDTKSHIAKGDWHFFAAFGCLALVNLMCAIDATILSVALSVCVAPENALLYFLLK